MKLLTWNIRASQQRGIIEYLAGCDADVLALTEYKPRVDRDSRLRDALREAGFFHQESSVGNRPKKGVLVASRHPLVQIPLRGWRAETRRAVYVTIPAFGLDLLAVYVPYRDDDGIRSNWMVDAIIRIARRRSRERLVLAGDFNSFCSTDSETGNSYNHDEMKELATVLADCFGGIRRQRRYTFASHEKGARVDHVFVARGLRTATARHVHMVNRNGMSDHSALVVRVS